MNESAERIGFRATPWRAFKRHAAALERRWLRLGRFDAAAVLSLLMLLFYLADRGQTPVAAIAAAGMITLAGAGIALAPLRRSPIFWALLAAPLLYADVWQGTLSWTYNHNYLVAYWCLALALVTLTARPTAALRVNARLIIGLCFGFATLWKVISPEFPGGSFFHFTILTDERFRGFAELAAGVPTDVLDANAQAMNDLRGSALPSADAHAVTLAGGERVAWIAVAMAVWTIALEGLIAASFLSPTRWRLARLRHPALFVFIVTTYPIATVPGFARLLAAMAFAACRPTESWARWLYLLAFVAVPAFTLPWSWIIRTLLG